MTPSTPRSCRTAVSWTRRSRTRHRPSPPTCRRAAVTAAAVAPTLRRLVGFGLRLPRPGASKPQRPLQPPQGPQAEH